MIRGDRPEICIYHGPGCHDGFAAAWALWQKWPGTTFIPAQYGDAPPLQMCSGASVLIVDFSYGGEDLRALAAAARSVTVLDHHEGAREVLETLSVDNTIKVTFDLNRSGAVLAWEYCWGSRPPKLIEFVQDRDLWKFEVPGTRAISALIGSHPYDFAVWTELARQMEDPGRLLAAIAEGSAIMRDRDKSLRELLQATQTVVEIGGKMVPVANVPYYLASDAGHILGEGQPFAATYFDTGEGKRRFSLRSGPEGADVNKIAKLFGGGGHVHAAGFSVDLPWPELPKAKGRVERID